MEPRRADNMNPQQRNICRQYLHHGHCPNGMRCRYRHDRRAPLCRHFLKGTCWFGNNCKFLHIFPPDGFFENRILQPLPGPHAPTLPGPHAATPSGPHAATPSGPHAPTLPGPSIAAPARPHTRPSGAGIPARTPGFAAEPRSPGPTAAAPAVLHSPAPALSSEETRRLQKGVREEGAAAAPAEHCDIICGICMDRIWEKPEAGERRFGILPNCAHAFCLGCIRTWRKTKAMSPEVVKSCPQCRVYSAFYMPLSRWVEGSEKAALIEAFKKANGEKTCVFYLRHGRCPFKADCLYKHDQSLRPTAAESSDDEDGDDEDMEGLNAADMLNMLLNLALDDSDDEHELNIFDLPYYLLREHFL